MFVTNGPRGVPEEAATFSFPVQKISSSIRSAFKSNSVVHTHPDGIRIHSREAGPTRCPVILVYCSVRDWTLDCWIRIYPDSPSTHYRIYCRLNFFHSRERIQKYPNSLPNLSDECRRKPYPERKVADSKMSQKESKKSRRGKHPFTC